MTYEIVGKCTKRTTDALERALDTVGRRVTKWTPGGTKYWIISGSKWGTRREYAKELLTCVNLGFAPYPEELDAATNSAGFPLFKKVRSHEEKSEKKTDEECLYCDAKEVVITYVERPTLSESGWTTELYKARLCKSCGRSRLV